MVRFALNRPMLVLITIVLMGWILIFPVALPLTISPSVQTIYDQLDAFPDDTVVYVNLLAATVHMYDGSGFPCIIAMWQHFFNRGYKIVFATVGSTHAEGPIYSQIATNSIVNRRGAVYGEDYVIFPLAAGGEAAQASFLDDVWSTYPNDYYLTATSSIPMMANIRSGDDFDLVMCAGYGIETMQGEIRQSHDKYGLPIVFAVPDSFAPGLSPYVQAGQALGVLAGSQMGAEYETLVGRPGQGLATLGQFASYVIGYIVIVVVTNLVSPLGRGVSDRY